MRGGRRTRRAWLAAGVAATLVTAARAGLGGRLYGLTDATFERETQASTGQTTGRWAVLLHAASEEWCGEACATALQVHGKLAADDRTDYVFGALDVAANPKTAERFGLDLRPGHRRLAVPLVLVFRGNFGYYNVSMALPPATPDATPEQALEAFLYTDFKQQQPLPVPKEITLIDHVLAAVKGAVEPVLGKTELDAAGVIKLYAGALVIVLLTLALALMRGEKASPPAAGEAKKQK